MRQDVFPVIRQLAGLGVPGRRGRRAAHQKLQPRTFDLTVLDPPRWSTGKFGTVDTVNDYPSLFKPALLATKQGGALLATNNVASVDYEAWVSILHRCANKAGRPLRDVERIYPEADFPSPDGRTPLKLAWIRV